MSVLSNNLKVLRLGSGKDQAEIAELAGITASTLSNYEVARTEPDIDTLVILANIYGVSVDGLVKTDLSVIAKSLSGGNLNQQKQKATYKLKGNGNGNPKGNLNEKSEGWDRVPKVITVDHGGSDNIAFVPVKAHAGYLNGYGDAEFIGSLETFRFPGLSGGVFRCFEVEGQSMLGTFYSSDWIVGRFVENLTEIRDDRIHIVVTKTEGIVVKRVLNRIEKDGKLILNSDNQRTPLEFPPIILDPNDVFEVWYAVRYSSSQMRRPGEMQKRVIDLEGRVSLLEDRLRK
jgi:transcriptional regulator with XRE-family HTH domain